MTTHHFILLSMLGTFVIVGCGQEPEKSQTKPLHVQDGKKSAPHDAALAKKTINTVKADARDSATPDLANGARQFSKCKVCHTINEGGRNKVGPNLFGIVDRPAASKEGFRYSAPLKKSGIIWDEETLNTWINNPRTTVPGTSMSFVGIRDEKSRRDLLAYLLRETASSAADQD